VRCSQRRVVKLRNNEWDIGLPAGRRGQQVRVKVKVPCLIKNGAIYAYMASGIIINIDDIIDRFCSLVVRFSCYRSRGPGSIPGSTRFSEK
jgi:hypothetical protein